MSCTWRTKDLHSSKSLCSRLRLSRYPMSQPANFNHHGHHCILSNSHSIQQSKSIHGATPSSWTTASTRQFNLSLQLLSQTHIQQPNVSNEMDTSDDLESLLSDTSLQIYSTLALPTFKYQWWIYTIQPGDKPSSRTIYQPGDKPAARTFFQPGNKPATRTIYQSGNKSDTMQVLFLQRQWQYIFQAVAFANLQWN